MSPQPHEPASYHVLLIGIDAYDGGASLHGCVNDIDRIQRSLIDRVGIGPDRIKRLAAPLDDHTTDVPEELPTLANIRAALADLAGEKVKPGDRVFIYYSGHGTQVKVVEPNGASYVREAILPTDFLNLLRKQYLFDWEFNALLARIAARTSAVTVILDCCCSTGATRELADATRARVRYWPSPEPYALGPDDAPPGLASLRGLADGIPATVQLCQVAAACLADERARESDGEDGFTNGELTRALLNQLDALPADAPLQDLRWGRIWRAVVSDVAERNQAQHPWLSGGFARRVFGGPPEDGDTGYGIAREGDTYLLQVGTLSGVTEGATVAVYGSEPAQFPPLRSDEDVQAHAGRILHVTHAGPSTATAAASAAPFDLPAGARARLISAGKSARLRVALRPHDAALSDTLSDTLADTLADTLSTSPFLAVVEPGAKYDVALERRADGGWAVTDDVFGPGDAPREPTLAVIPPDGLPLARSVLEHYFWYSLPLRLARECLDLPKALQLKLLDCNGLPQLSPEDAQNPNKMPPEVGAGALAPYQLKAGSEEAGGDLVCVRIANTSDVDLTVTLIACQTSGAVGVVSEARIAAGDVHIVWDGATLGVPCRIWLRPGTDVGIDRLVAIGTTRRDASLWHLATSKTFAEVLNPTAEFRELGGSRSARSEPIEQWTSSVLTYRLER